jgi:hypothetical protein
MQLFGSLVGPSHHSPMMETERVSEKLDSSSELTRLVALGDFIAFSCREIVKSYLKNVPQKPKYVTWHSWINTAKTP